MIVFKLLVLMLFAWCCDTARTRTGDVNIYPHKPVAVLGNNMILTLKLPTSVCKCMFNGNLLNGSSNAVCGIQDGECSITISSATNDNIGNWTFLVDNNKSYQTYLEVQYQNRPTEHQEVTAEVGQSVTLTCSSKGVSSIYTRLYEPDGNLVAECSVHGCEYSLSKVNPEHGGIWTCVTMLEFEMVEHKTTIALHVNGTVTMKIGKTETDKFVNLFCNHLKSPSSGYCMLERPDGFKINPVEGNIYKQYRYYGEGIAQQECGLSIRKPLSKEDYGNWKCEWAKSKIGGFISVTKTPDQEVPITATTKHPQVSVLQGQDVSVQCQTRAQLWYCSFRTPTGKIFTVNQYQKEENISYTGAGFHVGECQVTIKANQVNSSDTGNWTCEMSYEGQSEGSKNIQIGIHVSISDYPFVVNSSRASAVVDSWAVLGCHAPFQTPLQYCRFIKPDGSSFNVGTTSNSIGSGNDRFQYHGNGLALGDCGIMINKVLSQDYGEWTCAATFIDNFPKEYRYNILLIEQGSGLASATGVGLAVGISVAVLVVIVSAVIIFIKRRRNRSSLSSQLASAIRRSSLASDES